MDTADLFGNMSGSQTFGLSPSSLEDDDDLGNMSDGDSIEQLDSSAGPKRKGRRLPSTAEKRANHNAIERARRESLNGRFMELAQALPTMAVVKRPSKNAIVLKSLEFVKGARAREQALEAENARLRSEVNELRSKLGMQLLETSTPTTVVSQAPTISAAKTEMLATRPSPSVTAKPVKAAPAAAAAAARAAAVKQPVVSRHNSTSSLNISTTAPYLAHDPLAASPAGMYGLLEPLLPAVKGEAGSPHSMTSDSDISLVHTPPSFHTFEGSPSFFFEETVHAPTTATGSFDTDFLAQCGLSSNMTSMAGWSFGPSTGMFATQSVNSNFPLFA